MKMNKTNKIIGITAVLGIFLICINLASAVSVRSVVVSPETIAPGQNFDLTINLKNNLDDATDVDVSLLLAYNFTSLPFSPVSTTEKFVGDLDNDDSDSASFKLIADSDAEAGVYKIPVQISYKINNSFQTKISFISISINAKPQLELSSDSILIVGQKNKLQIQVTNKGLAKAKFLEVQLNAGSYDILSSNKVYIGDLNSNDYDSASFDVFLNNNLQVIPVSLSYTDFANNQYSESQTLVVKSYTQKQAQELGLITRSNTMTYVIVVIVLIIIYLIYRRLRKRKMGGCE